MKKQICHAAILFLSKTSIQIVCDFAERKFDYMSRNVKYSSKAYIKRCSRNNKEQKYILPDKEKKNEIAMTHFRITRRQHKKIDFIQENSHCNIA